MNIGKRIKELRNKEGITASELAEISGVSQPHISQIETGRRNNPSISVVMKIAKALNVSLDEFFQLGGSK